MKRERQDQIRRIISAKPVGTQQELAEELARRGVTATQSSVSRDIVEMGLVKINGAYTLPGPALGAIAPVVGIETAGENLIVVKTDVGEAQPVALTIDRARITEIVGTVAGDDTILIAVKDAARQRSAVERLKRLFTPQSATAARRGNKTRPVNRIAPR